MRDHQTSFETETLESLFEPAEFRRRHIGTEGADDRRVLLDVIGVSSVDELIDRAIPESIRLRGGMGLGAPSSEADVTAALRDLAAQNSPRTSLIGQGYTGTITPPVIRRNMLENPAWYTSYTPYQAEISQGRLESLLNFQTMVTDLTGLEVANASLLDEATAAAEAMVMARRASKVAHDVFFVHADTHPQTVAVLRHRARPLGIEVRCGELDELHEGEVFGALFSFPTSSGALLDVAEPVARVRAAGGLAVLAVDPLASVLLRSAGSFGADIAIGSAQRFGVPMGFGGPHAAFMATTESLARTLPGRLVGVSTDERGRPAMRLALQTREQHIRREKATSNICTAQALLANVAAMYAVWHGADGLRRIAERVHRLTSIAADGFLRSGFSLGHATWFDTLTIGVPGAAPDVLERGRKLNIDFRLIDADHISLTFDETSSINLLLRVWEAFGIAVNVEVREDVRSGIPTGFRRTDEILSAEVFRRYRTEHEMLRYLRRLADRDLALDRTMIPLGSCTMKLNATTEMEPITWPDFAGVHPYAPSDETVGYRRLIQDLTAMLVAVTGYDAVSLQPNAGSQGEFAGLMAIRAYHRSRGDDQRTVCLIPSSAHGTNAASAVMAGMSVTVVACDDSGNVDLTDLRAKIDEAGDRLGAVMVTYPSTHGVFEADI
ncbi:MAG: aminomethyl-transferring glycine dehydrogenase, partial [Actinomycetota bacterium]